ncbi:carbohydrate ABC transporter permease [Paenibacillus sp. FSL H7-0331]|uniref:carbohydrate ABC transporter permease n=1 Tax=Paenibacillus sp. FSL H7-0331 TaxID=1920421 RepID=UPI00096FE93E|nr:carbohydrate ABC transporter permease [Paenibacillus sp. FSL H7-0331]OMF16009.1 sugar ABC transporter permease [Paenibacillus sp. FSL H7-0331]
MGNKSSNQWIFNVILVIAAAFFIWPLYWMVTGSFKNLTVAIQIPPEWIPLQPTWINYRTLFVDHSVIKWFGNSLFISSGATVCVLLLSSMAAYAIAKIQFKAGGYIFALMVGSLTLPHAVMFIPLFQMMNELGLINTYAGAMLPVVGWPFGVFLLRQFMQTLPTALIEAARIDGGSEVQIFTRVILPLAKPGLAVLAIFTFVNTWNDYVWQLLILTKDSMFTLPVGVRVVQKAQEFHNNYGIAMAGAVLATLPLIGLFVYFQKYFTKGITLGAVKG